MMHIRILSVGKTPKGAQAELVAMYKKYLQPFAKLAFVEVKELAHLPDDVVVILLDECGKEFRSIEFAKWLQPFEDNGETICFVIGGPFGLTPAIKKEATHTIALSKMTLPHDLAKVILLEQLFRAFTILRGKSYHY